MEDLIEDFIYGTLYPYFNREETSSADAAYIRRELIKLHETLNAERSCLTGQEEFTIFQREEQAPKETPRPE
jgi:hypothetical protein